ncbi:unnamed protein product, partial [Linum tenue]
KLELLIYRWWVDLDVATNFKYARDRIAECYLWVMGMYFEPKYSQGRRLLTKLIAVMSLGDDTYDNYATYEELVPFTEAIERWDINLVSNLPECMQRLYALYRDSFDEIEEAFAADGRPFAIVYAKKAVSIYILCTFVEYDLVRKIGIGRRRMRKERKIGRREVFQLIIRTEPLNFFDNLINTNVFL